MTTIIGIDPGIVHTGVVVMQFRSPTELLVTEHVYTGAENDKVIRRANASRTAHIFIEAYRPRGNVYQQDKKMRDIVATFKAGIPRAHIIDNTGSKGVVSQQLMELFGVWKFQQKTHHQDLRSAARIALYGALKSSDLNAVLFEYAFHKLNP